MSELYVTEFVRLRPQTIGVLYRPVSPGPEGSIGLISMHPNFSVLTSLACLELAKRGFTVLALQGQYSISNRELMVWENVPLDVKPAVELLRGRSDIRSVVLVGHSGGGQLMPFYQNLAENGVAAGRVPNRIAQAPDELGALPAADGVVLLDAHHGYGANMLTSLDPAVVDESSPEKIDPALDMYDPRNGYDPAGAHYTEAFKHAFYQAQGERMNRLTQRALERRAAIRNGTGAFPDDEPFLLARQQARLWQADLSLVERTRGAYPVLKAEGAVSVEIAHSVRVPSANTGTNASFAEGAIANTVESFLSTHTIRTTPDYYVTADAIQGVDWGSSNTSTAANLTGVHAPLLIMAMTAHYWMVSSELFFQQAASRDKALVFVEGATHGFTPCKACEGTPGQFGDTVATTFNYLADWIRQRFVA